MNTRLYLLLIALLLWKFADAQLEHQKFYHLTRTSGLSQSTVNCIIKDAEGYMWFGTRDGVNRYDGYNFRHYRYKASDPNSLGLGRINVLFVDTAGQLWVGADQGGLNRYRPESDDFLRYTRMQHEENGNLNDVRDIIQGDKECLWLATHGSGLLHFDPEKNEFESVPGTQKHNITCLELSEEGDLYLGTPSGLYLIDDINSRTGFAASPILIEGFKDMQIIALYSDYRNTLWVGTYGNGAISFDLQSKEHTRFSTKEAYPYQIGHDIVRAFCNDGEGNLLIGTGGGGLNSFNPEQKSMELIIHKMNNQYSLSSNIIYSIYSDDNENVWIGTYNGGANVLFRYKDKFGHIKSYGEENSLSNNAVLAIVENHDGKLWIGTDGGGLDSYDPATRDFKNFTYKKSDPNSISGNVVKTLFFDKHGILWIGTFGSGLNTYDPIRKVFKPYPYKPARKNGISSNHIWDIDEDAEGNIWLATLGAGLDRYNPETDQFYNYQNDPEDPTSLSDNTLSSLLLDHDGRLWIGTEFGGVSQLVDAEKGVFKVYNRTKDTSLISSNQISTLFQDSENNIWVGTIGGGLNLYLPDQDRFKSFTESDGLPNNLIYSILEDENGNLWISTNKGLSQFINAVRDPYQRQFRNFNVGDGLQSDEFSSHSACKTKDGTLYFGGINGFNYFLPSQIVSNDHIPPVVITEFKLFNETVTVNSPETPLEVPISQTKQLTLKHNQSVFSFQFAALDFTMPSQNNYRFILEGFEEKWNDVGTQRIASYTNLNPGSYVFRVQGSNNDGVWNETGASINITILAPYWKTWWFRAFIVLLISIVLSMVFWWRIKAIEQQRRKLKKLVNERTRELLDLNSLLENQNSEIQSQREELIVQKENLEDINAELAKNQKKIQDQNIELENHHNNLQELVRQRTSELETAKIKAEESDQLKSAFLANMSHEIRTPLNAIVGFSALLAEGMLTEKERDEYLVHITSNTNTLLVLIGDILDLSKIESNQLDISMSDIALNAFIEELTNAVAIGRERISFRIINKLAEEAVVFRSDRVRLRQVLSNLLDNAFKFTEEGYIEFGVRQSGRMLFFHIEDSGIGMSSAVVDKIFDRFYKFESLASKLYRGTGLGLTITLKLVNLLGGKIRVESKEGEGSRFEVQIPMGHDTDK